ncbi:MAG: hypothetical protein PHU85_16485, partial [Phycisphaerae bacterium]|nr:hypothetical protein [Phycisphaerae bacterium]
PLLMLWPGHIQPRWVRDVAYSQLDIAPTLMDALGLRADNHFCGRSMLPETTQQQPIPLHQPFNGIYLISVEYPLKYIAHRLTGQEWMFNLKTDPHEDHNVVRQYRGTDELKRLRAAVRRLEQNQRLIEEDRIWPGE